MANILTAAEAANVLRCLTTDAAMLQLLPQVDKYIKTATGRDWTADTTIERNCQSRCTDAAGDVARSTGADRAGNYLPALGPFGQC